MLHLPKCIHIKRDIQKREGRSNQTLSMGEPKAGQTYFVPSKSIKY
jgi:hypothetical protein